MPSFFIVLDIGCLECGEKTSVISIHTAPFTAQESLFKAAAAKGATFRPDGCARYVGEIGDRELRVLSWP